MGMAKRKASSIVLGIVASAFALALAALCAGCGGGNASVVGEWSFESMVPTQASLDGLDETAKSDRESESSMLSVFMTDAVVKFEDGGKFTMVFLGEPYEGTWEAADGGAAVTMADDDVSSATGTYKVVDGKLQFTPSDTAGRLTGFDVVYQKAEAGAAEAATQASVDNTVQSSDGNVSEEPSGKAADASDAPADAEESAGSSEAASDESVE